MSRLDSVIRRLQAQRACLEHALRLIADLDGPILELGLGNGRTYDHLRERAPTRAIYVMERDPQPHPLSRPDDDHLLVGHLEELLPTLRARFVDAFVLVHSDIGTGDAARNSRLAAQLPGLLTPLMAARAVLVSDQLLADPAFLRLPPPEGVAEDRYFLYARA